MNIFQITVDQSNWNLRIEFSLPILLGLVLLLLVGWFVYSRFISKRLSRLTGFEIDEAALGIGDQRLVFRPNYYDLQVAYQLWAELATRKIGLPIDVDNDLIVDIYGSWYHFFCDTRELIKTIPVRHTQSKKGTRNLIETVLTILNDEMRPHLTRWQAHYLQWWKVTYIGNVVLEQSPQEVQRQFPEYSELLSDLLQINKKLVAYKEKLHEIVYS